MESNSPRKSFKNRNGPKFIGECMVKRKRKVKITKKKTKKTARKKVSTLYVSVALLIAIAVALWVIFLPMYR